jgi:thiol-disulfide isomerase/thioredoxin
VIRSVVLALVLAGCSAYLRPARAIPSDAAKALPTLSYRLRDGSTWSTADARGKVVVLDVWATYCKPCKKGFPKLDRIHALGSDVVVIGVSIDAEDKVVDDYLRTTPATFTIGRDPTLTVTRMPLWLTTLPTVIVLDRQGRLRYRGLASEADEYDRVRLLVVDLLAER